MLQIFAIINASSVMYSGKKAQHDFPKMRGGVKGRLEHFQKFITFGDATLPLPIFEADFLQLTRREALKAEELWGLRRRQRWGCRWKMSSDVDQF